MKYSSAALPLLLVLHLPLAFAQNACNSDGAPAPQALYERFISADCADCWSNATFAPGASAAVLDWIAPGREGDEAPLSAAARTDALTRLEALGRKPPAATDVNVATLAQRLPGRLRVSFGPAVSDYVGTSVSYLGALPTSASDTTGEWTVWLALVEQIPAGEQGTPVRRNLVRNLYSRTWGMREVLLKKELTNLPSTTRWIERRSMEIAPSTNPDRLAVVGWMEDGSGQVVATAQTECPSAKP
ncbi:MAG: hypothetical protein ACTS5V_03585 [Giesbergeria sp.]